jgi:hypothetical protein
LSGDYNGDGFIEEGDLDLVLLNWGQPAFPPPGGWVEDLPAGEVSQSQLDQVLLNWGRPSGTVTAASSIPEPPAAALLAVAACVLGCGGLRTLHAGKGCRLLVSQPIRIEQVPDLNRRNTSLHGKTCRRSGRDTARPLQGFYVLLLDSNT